MAKARIQSVELDGIEYPVFYDKYGGACANVPCEKCGELHRIQVTHQSATICLKCFNSSPERAAKISASLIGFKRSDEQKEKNRQATLSQNKHLTDEEKEHLRQIFKGREPWNKGKELTEEDKLHKSEAQKIIWADPEFKAKQEAIMHSANPNVKQNYPEEFMEAILNEVCPNEYEYVGTYKSLISGYSPDFINIKGRNKVIEVFGSYWHSYKKTKRCPIEEILRRKDLFSSLEFESLIIWEHELVNGNIENVMDKIKEFNKVQEEVCVV